MSREGGKPLLSIFLFGAYSLAVVCQNVWFKHLLTLVESLVESSGRFSKGDWKDILACVTITWCFSLSDCNSLNPARLASSLDFRRSGFLNEGTRTFPGNSAKDRFRNVGRCCCPMVKLSSDLYLEAKLSSEEFSMTACMVTQTYTHSRRVRLRPCFHTAANPNWSIYVG